MRKAKLKEPETKTAAEDADHLKDFSVPLREIVVGLVGFAGSFDISFGREIVSLLVRKFNYRGHEVIKISDVISSTSSSPISKPVHDHDYGKLSLQRAVELQDAGDLLRARFGDSVLASKSIERIRTLRGGAASSSARNVYVIDSLKHQAEANLLRSVYGSNFVLVAVHSSTENRKDRLADKFKGMPDEEIEAFMARDESDSANIHGQQVRKVFYSSDFFIDNDSKTGKPLKSNPDLERFFELLLGLQIHRPTRHETGMYQAYSAALRSSCLSRQVGASIVSADGRTLSTGTNEVPKFGGGVYEEGGATADCRCFKWNAWGLTAKEIGEKKTNPPFCHNSRKKKELKSEVHKWFRDLVSLQIARKIVENRNSDAISEIKEADIKNLTKEIATAIGTLQSELDRIPGIGDLIEFSRSIHAEMDAILTAGRNGVSVVGSSLYTSTFPCHNCARHIVSAGIVEIIYLEPYKKSRALELHSDSISHETKESNKLVILPFTGVGPAIYPRYFQKSTDLKDDGTGAVLQAKAEWRGNTSLLSLEQLEEKAVQLPGLRAVNETQI